MALEERYGSWKTLWAAAIDGERRQGGGGSIAQLAWKIVALAGPGIDRRTTALATADEVAEGVERIAGQRSGHEMPLLHAGLPRCPLKTKGPAPTAPGPTNEAQCEARSVPQLEHRQLAAELRVAGSATCRRRRHPGRPCRRARSRPEHGPDRQHHARQRRCLPGSGRPRGRCPPNRRRRTARPHTAGRCAARC